MLSPLARHFAQAPVASHSLIVCAVCLGLGPAQVPGGVGSSTDAELALQRELARKLGMKRGKASMGDEVLDELMSGPLVALQYAPRSIPSLHPARHGFARTRLQMTADTLWGGSVHASAACRASSTPLARGRSQPPAS